MCLALLWKKPVGLMIASMSSMSAVCERFGRGVGVEELGRHLVHRHVRCLRRKDHSHQQLEVRFVAQHDVGARILGAEPSHDLLGTLCSLHGGVLSLGLS